MSQLVRILCLCAAVLCAGLLPACTSTQPSLPLPEQELQRLVKLRFEGNRSFETKGLRALALNEMFLFHSKRPSKASVDDAAYALRLFYLERGYRSVEVEYAIDPEDSALSLAAELPPLGVSFTIREGSLTHLRGIEFLGQPSLKAELLRSFFGLGNGPRPFVRSEVDLAIGRLRAYYLDLGYRDIKLELESISFEEEAPRAFLTLRIQEGLYYRLSSVTYGHPEGQSAPSIAFEDQDLLGEGYTPRLAFRLRSRILDAYARGGYPRCSVEWQSELDAAGGEVRLHYVIDPGAQVVLKAILLSGNELTRGSTIRARLPIQAGQLYDAGKIQEGLRQLYASGLFDSVRIELDEADQLLVAVQESSSLDLRVEAGWGSYEGPRLNVVLDERNFLGTARRASLAGHVSPLASGARLSFYEPRIFGSKTDASASIFSEQREEPSFSFENLGFDVVLRRRLQRHLVSSLGYEFRVNELNDVDVLVQDPEELEEPNVGLVVAGLIYDDRDDLLLPTRGTRARLQLEWAQASLGSEIDFLRSSLGWSHVFELGPSAGLAFNVRSVLTHTLGGQEVLPLNERAFLGGENSVRSFNEDDLGPLDASGQPRGGEASTFFSVEWRRRLAGNFGAALFFDGGNVVEAVEDTLHFDDYRFGLGVGLRYALPIGPLRIDLGYNPAAGELEDDFVLHFSVGYSF